MKECMADHVELHQEWRKLTGAMPERPAQPCVHECTDACLLCKRAFHSLAAWASHAAKKHGYRALSTKLARGRLCMGCGKAFSTQHRLKRHLDHFDSCLANWGAFTPAQGGGGASEHLQAPPSSQPGVLDLDFDARDLSVCEELLGALARMREGSAFDVLNVVTQHVAPIAVLRRTVEQWHAALPDTHVLKEPAEDVKLTLYPEFVLETVQPFRSRQHLWTDEPPALPPLSAMGFVCTERVVCFSIPKPPGTQAGSSSFPWKGFHALREARLRAAWTKQALNTSRAFVLAAMDSSVCLVADQQVQLLLPALMRWFQELGVQVQGSLIKSRCFT